MALDRTWYNALVDDSGDGLSGSVWDKADIKNLLDSIDAEILRVESKTVTGTFLPEIGSSGGGTPLYAFRNGLWIKADKQIWIGGRVALSSKGSLAAGEVLLQPFPYFSAASINAGAFTFPWVVGLAAAVAGVAAYMNTSDNKARLQYWPAAGGTGNVPLLVAGIANNLDLIFSGTYKID